MVAPYDQAISNGRLDIMPPQAVVETTFLLRYGKKNGLQCLTGTGSTSERPLAWLGSNTTRQNVYKSYRKNCTNMLQYNKSERVANDKPTVLASVLFNPN